MQGSLDMTTVPAIFEKGLQHLAHANMQVDFSQVESVDSAAVSMLLGWERVAQQLKREFSVSGMPADLLILAHLYGVEALLPAQAK